MRRIKLGILQTNHDKSVEVGDAFPDDAHRFRDLFDLQDERFTYRIYMTIGGEVPQDLDEQDVYMITGSPLSVLDQHVFTDALLDFIRRCDAAQKPLLGACFGHQAIALALGGTVERSSQGYNVGVEDTRFHETTDWMVPPRDSLLLYVFHEDHVTHLPEAARFWAQVKIAKSPALQKAIISSPPKRILNLPTTSWRVYYDLRRAKCRPPTQKRHGTVWRSTRMDLFLARGQQIFSRKL